MKILFVLEHFHPYIGGAEKLFYVLTKALVKDGYEVTVVTTLFDKNLPAFLSLPKIMRHAKGADLIHTTTYNAALPAVIAGKLLKKPIFVTFHEVWGKLWRQLPFTSFVERNAFYFFEKMLLNLPFSKFIAVSEFTKSELIKNGISPSKIKMIYNGIDYRLFEKYSPTPPEIFTFTYFGRLGISKGLNLLIPAAAEFRKSFPNTKLKLIIPKYPTALFQKIMMLIEVHHLKDYIEFHHNLPREELYHQLLCSSCVVISSYSEGFCFAAAETVALNIPIISSHQGALKETVSGQFIAVKDMTVPKFTNALEAAYLQNWKQIPTRFFYLKDSVEEYKKCYQFIEVESE